MSLPITPINPIMPIMSIIHLDETTSTNNWLRSHQAESDEGIIVVTADYQTDGRGQASNHWESERGKNLLFSIRFHPTAIPASQQFLVSMIVSVAVCETLSNYATDFSIKWPNDIYWKDRKICGILIENRLSGQAILDTIAGIGMNINQAAFHSDAPNPVSLRQILGTDTERQEVLDLFLTSFKKHFQRVESGDTTSVKTAYKSALYRRNGYHTYSDRQGCFEAKLVDIADNGTLFLEDVNGKQRSYAFKEVEFVRKGVKRKLKGS